MPDEWTLEKYLDSLIERWEQGTLDADDLVRELRTTLREEREIREQEKLES
jgi:hypothetical protein